MFGQHKDLDRIKEELTRNALNLYDWFIDNMLRIYFSIHNNVYFENNKQNLPFSRPKTKQKKQDENKTLDVKYGKHQNHIIRKSNTFRL